MNFEKKKIRGWKRRKRGVGYWKENFIHLNKIAVQKYSRDYVKLWISPFSSLNRYKFPNWYKKLLIDSLIEIYYSWQQELDHTKQYYLKIWIFEKNFMNSQVVIATDEYLNFYDDSFEDMSSDRALPFELRTTKTSKFNWEQGYIVNMYRESELIESSQDNLLSNKEVRKIKNSAYLVKTDKNDKMYFLKDDTVWIGEHLK